MIIYNVATFEEADTMKHGFAVILMGLAWSVLSISFVAAGGIGLLTAEAADGTSDSSAPYISVSVNFSGSLPDDPEGVDIVIQAEDPSYPLPDGADTEEGVFVWTVSDNAEMVLYFVIGDEVPADGVCICYDSVDIYRYTIYQSADSFSGNSLDESVFSLEVFVSRVVDENGNVVGGLQIRYVLVTLDDDEAEKLDAITFENIYPTSSSNSSSSDDDSSSSTSTTSSGSCYTEKDEDDGGDGGDVKTDDGVTGTTSTSIPTNNQTHINFFTGDSSTILLWLLVLIACLAIISYVIFRIRKDSV